jgi:hypothetical protein
MGSAEKAEKSPVSKAQRPGSREFCRAEGSPGGVPSTVFIPASDCRRNVIR